MKYLLIFLPFLSFAQQKQDNTIIVKNVSFSQIVNGLLDSGYAIQKLDSNYKTVTTEFINCPLKSGKPSTVNISISVRVKDSSAVISSKWYSEMFLSRGLFEPSRAPGPTDIHIVEYTWGANKLLFMRMDKFAKSFGQPVNYEKR